MAPGKRLQIILPPASVQRLESLVDSTEGDSYADVIRAALRLYEWMIGEAKKGKEFGVRNAGEDVFKPVAILVPTRWTDE
jgi:Arc/MetJ-type ribon-helix-helix transcriptional regulator